MKNDVTGCSEIKPEPVDDDLEEFFYHLILISKRCLVQSFSS